MKRTALILLTIFTLACSTAAASTLWENLGAPSARDIERIDESGMDIAVRDGVVTLVLSRSTPVKVLTILGQPVSQATLPAGVHRLKLPTRGIYILKVGQATRRVNF